MTPLLSKKCVFIYANDKQKRRGAASECKHLNANHSIIFTFILYIQSEFSSNAEIICYYFCLLQVFFFTQVQLQSKQLQTLKARTVYFIKIHKTTKIILPAEKKTVRFPVNFFFNTVFTVMKIKRVKDDYVYRWKKTFSLAQNQILKL